jgi:uncharacterized membrane protein YdjX (TVP38/TMEM64 family)
MTLVFVRRHWQKLVMVAFWLSLIGAYWGYAAHNHLKPIAVVRHLIFVMGHSAWGPLWFLAAFSIQPLVFFPSGLLSGAAGYVWGPAWGTIWSLAGHGLSALVAYFLGRYLGQDLLGATSLGRAIERYTESLRENSFQSVLFLRLIFLPYEQISVLCGFLDVKLPTFLLATALGSLPGVVAATLLGSSIQGDFSGSAFHLNPWVLGASALTALVSIGLWRVLSLREARRRCSKVVCPSEDGEA